MKELVYPRLLLPATERWADKEAFVDGAYRATYAEHRDRVLRLCGAMRSELGLGPTDRFAVMAANSHEYLELYHAGFLGAGVVNPLNLRLAGPELTFILEDSETGIVFVDGLFAEGIQRALDGMPPAKRPRVVLMGPIDGPSDMRYEDLVAAGDAAVPPEPEESDAVVLMYTGGTTGRPKGVVLDQRAELLNLYHIASSFGLGEQRVWLHQTPMFHAASMGGILGIPASGGTSVFVPLFEPAAVLEAIETNQVDFTVMVPTMIAMVLDHPAFKPERLASLTDLVYGASPIPTALLHRLLEVLPDVRIWQGYGMTESSSILTVLDPGDHRRGGDVLRSAGRPMMGVVLSIQDEHGNALEPGQQGEVCARAGNFMVEYWKRPTETAEAFRDGWYHTGDAGYLDDSGYLFLVDRVKDMIVTGGENVYSVEVENAISTLPGVAQVAVIGIPHPVWGEQVHAVVVPAPGANLTEEQVKEHARKTIAGYKVPKSVEFRTEPLPLSGAMKVLKRELREPYWKDAG